jgi:hypothetical protein
MLVIEIRTSTPKVVGNNFARSSMEMVLGWPIHQVIAITNDFPPRHASLVMYSNSWKLPGMPRIES